MPPPPRKGRRGILADVPDPKESLRNLSQPNSGLQDLNFKVDPALHHAFKVTAAMRNMPMKDLLDAAFRCYVEHYGTDIERGMLPASSKDK